VYSSCSLKGSDCQLMGSRAWWAIHFKLLSLHTGAEVAGWRWPLCTWRFFSRSVCLAYRVLVRADVEFPLWILSSCVFGNATNPSFDYLVLIDVWGCSIPVIAFIQQRLDGRGGAINAGVVDARAR